MCANVATQGAQIPEKYYLSEYREVHHKKRGVILRNQVSRIIIEKKRKDNGERKTQHIYDSVTIRNC